MSFSLTTCRSLKNPPIAEDNEAASQSDDDEIQNIGSGNAKKRKAKDTKKDTVKKKRQRKAKASAPVTEGHNVSRYSMKDLISPLTVSLAQLEL